MKKTFFGLAYRTVSWLSDRTGGWTVLVSFKVALAALIIGGSTTTFTSCEMSTCYDPAEIMCYDPAPTCYITPEEPCPEQDEEGEDEEGENEEGPA